MAFSVMDDVLSACYGARRSAAEQGGSKALEGTMGSASMMKNRHGPCACSALKEISRILGSMATPPTRKPSTREPTPKQKADPGEASQRREELLGKIEKQIALAMEEAGDPRRHRWPVRARKAHR